MYCTRCNCKDRFRSLHPLTPTSLSPANSCRRRPRCSTNMALSSLSSDALSALVLDPASYTSLVVAHAALTRDPDAFIRLDAELFPERAAAAASQSQLDVTKEKLMDILKWKLLRGKHRPFLPKLVASNSESAIRAAFAAAMALLTPEPTPASILAATSALSTPLKGVGPATASAVLAAVSPHVPFMSDEIMHSAGVRKPFKYSVKEYEQVLEWVDRQMEAFQTEAAASSSTSQHVTVTWTRRLLEQAVWARSVQRRTNPPSSASGAASPPPATTTKSKRKAGAVDDSTTSTHKETKRPRPAPTKTKASEDVQESESEVALRKSSRLAKNIKSHK